MRTLTAASVAEAVDHALGDPPPLLCSVERASSVTDIGRSKLYELMASGEIESVKVGKRRLIPWAALEDFVERLRSA